MKRFLSVLSVGVALAASASLASPAHAGIVLYNGIDSGVGPGDPTPMSDAAAASFGAAASAAGTVGLINFESAPVGAYSSLVIAPGVTLTGTNIGGGEQSINDLPQGSPNNLYGFNTTPGGANYASLEGGSITFTFAKPIQFFGAYLSGVQGIFGAEFYQFNDGANQSVSIPVPPNNLGGVEFFGFTDFGTSITSLTITAADDATGADDVRYGPISTAAVPEPSSLALTTAAIGSMAFVGFLRRRRRSAS